MMHGQLPQMPEGNELFKSALHGSYITSLCRDEVIHTHLFIMAYYESVKG